MGSSELREYVMIDIERGNALRLFYIDPRVSRYLVAIQVLKTVCRRYPVTNREYALEIATNGTR